MYDGKVHLIAGAFQDAANAVNKQNNLSSRMLKKVRWCLRIMMCLNSGIRR